MRNLSFQGDDENVGEDQEALLSSSSNITGAHVSEDDNTSTPAPRVGVTLACSRLAGWDIFTVTALISVGATFLVLQFVPGLS